MLELRVNEVASLTKTFTAEDVRTFADISLDTNPIHLNESYAATTPFGRCIVHGKLVEGLVSAVLGTKLPGPMSVFRACQVEYLAPVYVGEEVTALVITRGQGGKPHWVELGLYAYVNQKAVLTGTALITLPKDKIFWR